VTDPAASGSPRRPSLTMSTATFAVGLSPGHATIGIAAPASLLLLRMVQSFLAAGEYADANTFVAEYLPDRHQRRGKAEPRWLGLSLGRYGYWLASWRFSAALAPARADSASASFFATSRWASALSC